MYYTIQSIKGWICSLSEGDVAFSWVLGKFNLLFILIFNWRYTMKENFRFRIRAAVNDVHLLSEPPAVDLHNDSRASLAAALRHGTVYTRADRAASWWQRWHTDGRCLTDRWHICTHRCARPGGFDTGGFGASTCCKCQTIDTHRFANWITARIVLNDTFIEQ